MVSSGPGMFHPIVFGCMRTASVAIVAQAFARDLQ